MVLLLLLGVLLVVMGLFLGVGASGHDHAGGAVDAHLPGWGRGYLECWAESC